jgi:hypothetical protein
VGWKRSKEKGVSIRGPGNGNRRKEAVQAEREEAKKTKTEREKEIVGPGHEEFPAAIGLVEI